MAKLFVNSGDPDKKPHSPASDVSAMFANYPFRSLTNYKFLHAENEDRSDCADVQADLSLCWAHMSESTFSYVATHSIML